MGALALVFAPIAATVVGFGFMFLWNWVAPAVFGWHEITFWQGLGILLLSRLLFGRLGGGGSRYGGWRLIDRWERMSPEEREKFRAGLRHRCGAPPAAGPTPESGTV
jgi:hypothetical protein